MNGRQDNRAVTALFRVFGDVEELPPADAREIACWRGMHVAEFRTFSVLIPLSLWVAAADLLAGPLGLVVAWLLAIPLVFLLINVLPFVFSTRNQSLQWKLWLGVFVAWAVWHRHAPGVPGILAHVWIGVGILHLAAALWIDWTNAMNWPGRAGITWRIVLAAGLHGGALLIGFSFGWPWGVAAASAIGGLWCWVVLHPGSQLLGDVYRTTDDDGPLVTIDDGPDPHDTPLLLDLLDKHHTKAIFFMIGDKARDHPDLVREVARRGHDIGNHTLTHPQGSFWCAGPGRTWREIAECQEIIRGITGENPRWFRAPVGHRNLFTHPVCHSLGLRVMGWNRRGYDAVEKDASKVLERILPGMGPGDIVLLHEATPVAEQVLTGVLEKAGELERCRP